MAFRIPLHGMVIEADSAHDVQQLLVVMATPLPRVLAGAVVDEIVVPPSRRQRLLTAAEAPPVPTRSKKVAAFGKRYRDDVLRFVAGGPRRTGEVAADLRLDVHATRQLLKQLQGDGLLDVQGATLSRRWSLSARGRRAAAAVS